MLYITYLSLGLCAGLCFAHNPFELILCIIGSILPCLDDILKGQGRGVFHSVLLIVVTFFISKMLCLGLAIHAFLTLVSEEGGPLFWPYKENIRFPLMFPLRKGSFIEILILVFAVIGCFVLILGKWTPIFHGG